MNLPEKFKENMKNLLKNDYDKYIKSFFDLPKRGLRVNFNYINVSDFEKVFPYKIEKLNKIENGYELKTDEKIGNSIYHHLGLIYLQEPASMLPALCLDIKDGENVLDLCSAPGGKASQILERNKTGVVVLNEIVRQRANILFSNIERQGFKNAVITSLTPEKLAKKFTNFFDKILVDAPCSGEGMFRKDPETITEWNENLPEYNHQRQMDILREADKMLKQNGEIVYSTCTYNIEENEKTVFEFCEKFDYEIIDVPEFVKENTVAGFKYNNEKTTLARRCFAHNGFGEGQFMCKMIKKSQNDNNFYFKKPKNIDLGQTERRIINEFINKNLENNDFKFVKNADNVYITNDLVCDFDGVVNMGVMLGTINKDRIVPSHQLFKAYGEYFKNKINLDYSDEKVNKYLRGEEIDVNMPNGLAVVMVNNVPLGGGKITNNKLKNHYPKGLRNN